MSIDIPEGDGQGNVLTAILAVGNNLHLRDSNGVDLIAYPNGRGWWIPKDQYGFTRPGSISTGDEYPPDYDPDAPYDPDDPGDVTIQAKLLKWHKDRLGDFHYSQGSGRLNPDASGTTDCSGLQYACYKRIMGINVGTYSGDQATKNIGVTVTTTRSEIRAGTGMQKGDLIFYAMAGKTWSHVEMYAGGGQVIGISNVHQDGPRFQALKLQVDYHTGRLKVKRYV